MLFGLVLLSSSLLSGVGADVVCEPLGFPKQYFKTDPSRECCPYVDGVVLLEPANCIPCVDVREGDLNIILTIPHDGSFSPSSIPNRLSGCLKSDGSCIYREVCPDGSTRDAENCAVNTKLDYRSGEVAFKIHDYILERTGKCPTVIRSILHRKKLDPNRYDEDGEATQDNEKAKNVYQLYHESIAAAVDKLNGSPGLIIAIHGFASGEVTWTSLGYSISYNDLNDKTNEELDAMKDESSIKLLVDRTNEDTLSTLLFGQYSFGAYLEQGIVDGQALQAVPAPNRKPAPYKAAYYAATLSPTMNDYTDKIDSFQAEIHSIYRDNPDKTIRKQYQTWYAEAFGNAVINFYDRFYAGEQMGSMAKAGTTLNESSKKTKKVKN